MRVEDVPAPSTDEEALEMLHGDISSAAYITKYERLRKAHNIPDAIRSIVFRCSLLNRNS